MPFAMRAKSCTDCCWTLTPDNRFAAQPDDEPPARQGELRTLIARLPKLLILEVVRPLEAFDTPQVCNWSYDYSAQQ